MIATPFSPDFQKVISPVADQRFVAGNRVHCDLNATGTTSQCGYDAQLVQRKQGHSFPA